MSGNNEIQSHSEYPNLENESAQFNYDWAVAGYPQPSPFQFAVNAETISGGDDPFQANTTDRVNPKVAIPRNAQPSSWTSSGRVSRACESCREQKAKCSGHRPVCHRCQESGVRCSYGDRKREKMVKQLNDLNTRVETLNALLSDLYPKLDASSAQQVDQTLGGLNSRLPLSQVNLPTPVLSTNPSSHIIQSSISFSRANAGPVVAPAGAIDYTDEDFNHEKVRAMGFVGEHSEMAWLYRLKRDLDHENANLVKEIPEPSSISSVNYFQDESEILALDDLDLARRPPQHIANILVDSYFSLVHPTFPIVGKIVFLNQYRSYYANPNVRPGKRWIAVLNLVFAIATRHSFFVNQSQPDCDDHQTYFARAWMLSVRNVLLDHPDLQQTQVEGLAAFYLLSVGQANRSWRMIGIAIRSAVSMGLNIRSESESITHCSKELRYRVWWALFMLDTGLCEVTGRPPSTGKTFCTTPLPVPFAEESFLDERVVQLIRNQENRTAFLKSLLHNTNIGLLREDVVLNHSGQQGSGKGEQEDSINQPGTEDLIPNTSQYFLYAVDLAHLLREAINILYAPGTMRQSWHDIENDISVLNNHADNWLARLPAEFHFTRLDSTRQFAQQCASLAFRFYATKLIILQPCMHRISRFRSEATPPGSMCYQIAAMCLQMAGQLLDLLPEEPDLTWLYGVAPWWCILHNIMQSITILLTELFTHTLLGTAKAAGLFKQINKATRWLKEMSTKDPCSQRAWLVCMEILSQHGASFGFDVDALL